MEDIYKVQESGDFLPIDMDMLSKVVYYAKDKIDLIHDNSEMTLLHNDLNLTNIIVDEEDVTGIIDWTDTIYGDWLYDFARLRMNLEQISAQSALGSYRTSLDLSPDENSVEQLYYVCRLIEYIGFYHYYGKEYGVTRNLELLSELNILNEN